MIFMGLCRGRAGNRPANSGRAKIGPDQNWNGFF